MNRVRQDLRINIISEISPVHHSYIYFLLLHVNMSKPRLTEEIKKPTVIGFVFVGRRTFRLRDCHILETRPKAIRFYCSKRYHI